MKKIISLLLLFALMCVTLVSCDNAEKLLEKANAALLEEPYSMTMKMSFDCDNDEIDKILSMMEIELPMQVDGKNISMKMNMDVMDGYAVEADIRVVDKVMYYNMSILGEDLKVKSALTDAEYEDFLTESNTQMPVSPDDFANMTVEKKGDKSYIACAEISENALKELNNVLTEGLSVLGVDTEIKNVTYGLTLKDEKYEAMDMTCKYAVTVDGEVYEINFTASMNFEYGNFDKITAPAHAADYEEVSYDDFMG